MAPCFLLGQHARSSGFYGSLGHWQDTRCPARSCTLLHAPASPSTVFTSNYSRRGRHHSPIDSGAPTHCPQRPLCMSRKHAACGTRLDRDGQCLESQVEPFRRLTRPRWTPTEMDSGHACRRSSPEPSRRLALIRKEESQEQHYNGPPAQHHTIRSASCSSSWWGIACY